MNRGWIVSVVVLFVCCAAASDVARAANLVSNGSFETDPDKDGVPDGWTTSGHPDIKQRLGTDAGRQGGRSAKLVCTTFEGESGWHHVMICQVGQVGVMKGKWYRVSFWAKSEGKAARSVNVALSNMKPWGPSGLSHAFGPGADWQRFEFLFNATATVPAKTSRFQFWFAGVGTLWLDEVTFEQVDLERTWHPEITSESASRNLIPNSSFECGTAGWGGYTPQPGPWGANLYRLVGDLDDTSAVHGKHSLRVHLDEKDLPRLYFDYYEPYAEPVRSVLAANHGWFRVEKGKRYVLSASMRAAKKGTAGVLGVVFAEGWRQMKTFTIGTDGQRVRFPFQAQREYIHVVAGLDLAASKMKEATLWLDALQLEAGAKATDYVPRAPVEAFVSLKAAPITGPAERGLDVRVSAYNDGTSAARVRGTLTVTDGFDREIVRRALTLDVPGGQGSKAGKNGVRHPDVKVSDTVFPAAGRRGFFRVTWRQEGQAPQTIRLAAIDPVVAPDSRFGMNHAYPQQFLLESAKRAGVLWHRDWSVKWETVEPKKGAFDFSVPDTQIDRVLDAGGKVLLLFPFPSSKWASTADPKTVAREAKGNSYLASRLPTAFAAKDIDDFKRYIRESVRHYTAKKGSDPFCAKHPPGLQAKGVRPLFRGQITHYQVLNEPLYTSYALPERFGYKLEDYLAHLKAVHEVAKAEQPGCVIVGGLGGSPADRRVRRFIEAGGLKWVDVLDIHIYAAPSQFNWLENALGEVRALMKKRGEVRPMWVTEFGLYADDDPACVPPQIGDQTMARCARKSELAASIDLVRLTTMFAAYGVEKVFFHAGTARAINQPDAGNVFFEYGGAPRKMLPAAATLARLLPPGSEFVPADALSNGLKSYTFKTPGGRATVAWALGKPVNLNLPPGVVVYDLTGNRLAERTISVSSVPVYLVERGAHD